MKSTNAGQRGMTLPPRSRSSSGSSNYEVDEEERKARPRVRDIKEQEVYFGEIPLMTDRAPSSSMGPKGGS